jgi:hypothetical protein
MEDAACISNSSDVWPGRIGSHRPPRNVGPRMSALGLARTGGTGYLHSPSAATARTPDSPRDVAVLGLWREGRRHVSSPLSLSSHRLVARKLSAGCSEAETGAGVLSVSWWIAVINLANGQLRDMFRFSRLPPCLPGLSDCFRRPKVPPPRGSQPFGRTSCHLAGGFFFFGGGGVGGCRWPAPGAGGLREPNRRESSPASTG